MKKFLFLIFITFSLGLINSDESEITKFYLKSAYDYYNNRNIEMSLNYLKKAYDYSKTVPEYYYIYNLILFEKNEDIDITILNADNIIKYMKNSFFINNNLLLKQAGFIYKKTRNFDKSINVFNQIINIAEDVEEKDFKDYIEMLFSTNNDKYINLIPDVLLNASRVFDSIDYVYYRILYNLLKAKITKDEFITEIKKLYSNNYPEIKILFLKTLFYNDEKNIQLNYNELKSLSKEDKSEIKFFKRVLYNLLIKQNLLNLKQVSDLLNEWISIGNNDYKTITILKNKRISDIIKNKDQYNSIIKYSGERYIDDDEDGEWEVTLIFKTGVIINIIYDENQDKIYEFQEIYNEKGFINECISYNKNKFNYMKYIFNKLDQSLELIEFYENDKKFKTYIFTDSTYFPKISELRSINVEQLKKYISYIEEWKGNKYFKTKLYKSENIYMEIDSDHNNIIEEKRFYKNNALEESLKDLDENGKYEIFEKYENGILKYIKYKTDDLQEKYDYMEYPFKDYTIKYWDSNYDGIYEIKRLDYNNGYSFTYFDINYDGVYDYYYEEIDGELKRICKFINKKSVILKEFKEMVKQINKKWNIISIKDINKIELPEEIIINSRKKLSGIYYYKNEKFLFNDGLIMNKFFKYKLFFIGKDIYLLDLFNNIN